MVQISVGWDDKAARLWVSGVEKALLKAASTAMNETARNVRADITRRIPTIFSSVTPSTAKAVLYRITEGPTIADHSATVFIRDEGAAKSVPPSRYLLAEVQGGARRDKRSERGLISRGLMLPSQQWVPGQGAGTITGPKMVQILSRVGGFGEQGYRANATDKTKKRLKKLGILTHRRTGTDYFVAIGKRTDQPLAIYQIVGRGQVKPVLWFIDSKAQYSIRFPFHEMVEASVKKNWPRDLARALQLAARSLD